MRKYKIILTERKINVEEDNSHKYYRSHSAVCEDIEIKLYILGRFYFNYLLRPAFWDNEYMSRPICKEYLSLT